MALANPSGANSNVKTVTVDDLKDPAKYTSLPYIVTQVNLTRDMLSLLNRNRSEKFLNWHVKPGDHVLAKTRIATFGLEALPAGISGILRKFSASNLLTPSIFMPEDGIITDITQLKDLFNSEYLFSHQPLGPAEEADKYQAAPHEKVLQVLENRGHPRHVYWNVFQAIDILKTREDKTVTPIQVKQYIASKHLEMMPVVVPAVSGSNAPTPFPPGQG